jgi:hypothetical protein
MEDESQCFQLDCCPLGIDVPAIVVSEVLLIEAAVTDNQILTEDDVTILT